jgi:hypothetical protein
MGTARRFRVSLNVGVRTRFFSLLFVGVTFPLALAALPVACATAGSGGGAASGEGGGDDGATVEGGEGSVGDGGSGGEGGEGGGSGTTAAKACADNANEYCQQLSTCSNFLFQIEYGDQLTCEAAITPGCMDALAAPGTGWTGDRLEACITARGKLTCEQFFYAKPYPNICTPTGKIGNAACRYDAQCGSGYCRIPSGMMCGTCVTRGQTGALCQSTDDCDGDLMCSGTGTCAAPSGVGGPCSMMTPCNNGLQCLNGQCIVAGGVDAGCGDAGGACDYNLGAYCAGSSCAAVAVDSPGGSCGGSPPNACPSSSQCQQMFCVAPVADMGSCEGGLACAPPDTCNAGTCSLFTASQCK